MRVVVVSGSASGIGAAVRARLGAAGDRVVGVDLRDAEVQADLGTPAGRAAAVEALGVLTRGRLDGVVACAGVGPHVAAAELLASVNFFGAVALLDGLRPALAAARGAAVAVGSNSASMPGADDALAEACLAGDEPAARARAAAAAGAAAYAGGKLALHRWVRRHAPSSAWAGAGIRLNAVAPGATRTPLLEAGLDHPLLGAAIRAFPVPLGVGRPEQIADAVAFLLGDAAGFCCGTVLVADGGSDALLFPDR